MDIREVKATLNLDANYLLLDVEFGFQIIEYTETFTDADVIAQNE